jgi:RNA polymerase sigma-70 factor (ECF subfamily)
VTDRQEPSTPDGTPSDAELIARWKRGDERAATELVTRHSGALARFAASVGADGEIVELVQENFVRALASIDSFRGDSSLRSWLFTIQRRLLLDRRRAERRARRHTTIGEADAITEYGALDGLVADETQQRVGTAVGRLSPLQREIFVLRVTAGLSYKEIAEVVGSTEGAARVHYHNALRTVKEFLSD